MSFSCIDDLLYSLAHVNTEEFSEISNDFVQFRKKNAYILNFYIFVPVFKNTFCISIAHLYA